MLRSIRGLTPPARPCLSCWPFCSQFGGIPVRAQSALPPVLRQVGFDQRLNAQVPLDLTFNDEAGQSVQLGDYFGSKPVILVLAYFRCPMLCTQVLERSGAGACSTCPFDVGKEFNVVTVSFDPRETPEMAAAKKKTYLERYGRPGAEAGWHFLTGERGVDPAPDRGRRLSLHLRRQERPVRPRQRHHDPDAAAGRSRATSTTSAIRPATCGWAWWRRRHNRIGSPVDQVLLFCFHYDPAEGKYGAIVMNFVRLGGVLTVLGHRDVSRRPVAAGAAESTASAKGAACGLASEALSRKRRR